MTSTLIPGQKYDENKLKFSHWGSEGSDHGDSLNGYNWHDYIDAAGRYLGPDQDGIEPMFTDSSIEAALPSRESE